MLEHKSSNISDKVHHAVIFAIVELSCTTTATNIIVLRLCLI